MESAAPKVSLLVPCCDDGRFLDEALRSAAAQTYRDFEVLIADDASADDSPVIALAWAARDPRFRPLRNERRLGMTPNWNRALSAARGELVAKLDADDALDPGFLAALVGELESDPAVTVAFCRTLDCDETLAPTGAYQGDEALREAGLDPERRHVRRGLDWLPLAFTGRQLWTSNAQLHRRSELLAASGWDERWLSSDTELIYRVLERDRPVAHHPLLGIRYRRRTGSHRDGVNRRGWAIFEGVLLPLRSLERVRGRLGTRSRRVRFNWWRLWSALAALRRDERLWAELPPELRRVYETEIAALRPPPAHVRWRESARLRAWKLLERMRGAVA